MNELKLKKNMVLIIRFVKLIRHRPIRPVHPRLVKFSYHMLTRLARPGLVRPITLGPPSSPTLGLLGLCRPLKKYKV